VFLKTLPLFAQDIKFVPRTTELAVGQITIVSRCDVQASTSRSSLEATSGKETRTIDANKSYSVIPLFGVDYNDSWKPTLQDYPEYRAMPITTARTTTSPVRLAIKNPKAP